MAEPEPFVLLATLGDPAAAELAAARLRAEGIPSQLRGESLGPYRLTVGDMARTELWVPRTRFEEARGILRDDGAALPEEDEVGDEHDPASADPAPGPWPLAMVLAAAALVALAGWILLSRLL